MEYKNYNIEIHPSTSNYTIHSIGKGALPKTLTGLFTTQTIAKVHIDRYVDKKETTKE